MSRNSPQNELNAKISLVYLSTGVLSRSTGDTLLAGLICRLINKGYRYGYMSVINYEDLPLQNWVLTAQWQYSYDSLICVKIQKLYDTWTKMRWLNWNTGQWTTNDWI